MTINFDVMFAEVDSYRFSDVAVVATVLALGVPLVIAVVLLLIITCRLRCRHIEQQPGQLFS